jgi:acyl carrier protein
MSVSSDDNSPSFEAICAWLTKKIAQELEVAEDRVRIDEQFADLGLGSRQAILITGELEDFLRRDEIDPSLLWDFPTIEKLARHLVGG